MMATHHPKNRLVHPRPPDQLIGRWLAKYARLMQAGQIVIAELNTETLFDAISDPSACSLI
jgi:hypothetical protein